MESRRAGPQRLLPLQFQNQSRAGFRLRLSLQYGRNRGSVLYRVPEPVPIRNRNSSQDGIGCPGKIHEKKLRILPQQIRRLKVPHDDRSAPKSIATIPPRSQPPNMDRKHCPYPHTRTLPAIRQQRMQQRPAAEPPPITLSSESTPLNSLPLYRKLRTHSQWRKKKRTVFIFAFCSPIPSCRMPLKKVKFCRCF